MYAQEKIKPYNKEEEKTPQVERMFNSIAHSYDRLNHLFSLNIDRAWRRKTIEALLPYPHQNILDIATGTGDFALLSAKMLKPAQVVGADISEGMMDVAREKVKKTGLEGVITFRKEDCLNLTFPSRSFDAVTVAYGVRNFSDLDRGLKEMLRVLKGGGHAAILELTAPARFPMRQLFWLYSHVVMRGVGALVSRDSKAYDYLPASMEAFPQGEQMRAILLKAGFENVRFRRFTFGLSTMYIAQAPADNGGGDADIPTTQDQNPTTHD